MTACSPSCLGRLAYVARIPRAQHEEPSCCRRGTRPSPCLSQRPPYDDPPSSSRPPPTHLASSCSRSSRGASSPAGGSPDQQLSGAACIGERLHDSSRGRRAGGKANHSIRKRIVSRTALGTLAVIAWDLASTPCRAGSRRGPPRGQGNQVEGLQRSSPSGNPLGY